MVQRRLLQVTGWFVALLPRVWAWRLARLLGWIAFDVLRIRRRLVLTNLHRAFGRDLSPTAIATLARLSYTNMFATGLEVLRGTTQSITDHCDFEGRDYLEAALTAEQPGGGDPRGCYVLCCHLGNWEVMAAAVSRYIRPAHVVVKPVGSPSLNSFVTDIRVRNHFVPINRSQPGDAYRAMVKALRAGDIVGFVLDQSRSGEPRIPFMGHPARTNTGLAKLWLRHPRPIVPGWIERVGFDQHRITFLPPLELASDASPTELTTIFNRVLESMIRQRPAQYLWQHNRWKD